VSVLRLEAAGAESLWDELLPEEVRVLPMDLAAIDELLSDRALLGPIASRWEREARALGRSAVERGRPTIAMDTYVRLMVLKQRYGWGYRTLVAEVSDSLHLRRFCRIALGERVPDESTVRKLTRRLGPETVNEITRAVIVKARREKRFRPRAVRIDSTVIEPDVRYPTDAGLAAAGVRALAREGRKLALKINEKRTAVSDRSRAVGRRLRAITRTIRRRSGEAKTEVLRLTAETGGMLTKSAKEARRLAAAARLKARGRGARAKLRAAARLEELADRCERVAEQIVKRVKGEPIKDRLISLWDPDARPIRKGKLGKPTEFGYVTQLAEVTQNTKRGARGFILPTATAPGNPSENQLLPETVQEMVGLGLAPREVILDGGFMPGPTNGNLAELEPRTCSSPAANRKDPGAPSVASRTTAPAPKGGSATSSAATGCAAAG
jgi:transposase, IS5 family